MKVALVNTFSPHIRGGAEIAVDDLQEQLRLAGHNVQLIRLPFPTSFDVPLLNTIIASRLLCLSQYEKVIAFKFPAYCVRHTNKTIWLFHQFRQVYELWGTDSGMQPSPANNRLKDIITNVDNIEIPSARNIFTNAKEVSNRLKNFNNIESEVLMPPLLNNDKYYNDGIGDFIYYPSRITPLKRQLLAIEAMKFTKTPVRLQIAGVSEEPAYFTQMIELVKREQLENKVDIINRWISDEEKLSGFANCLAAIYIPFKEDSCGFVSMEAFYSSKPVISCHDSGGTGEIIRDGWNGRIVESDPVQIAQAMDSFYLDKQQAINMGANARADILGLNINWATTIEKLLA